ncbi:MAG: Hypothetical protein AJITA_00976 [Acetilactobacillus jinshanensis]
MAIILDIIGAVMTASREKTLGFVAYNSLPKIPNASGWRM